MVHYCSYRHKFNIVRSGRGTNYLSFICSSVATHFVLETYNLLSLLNLLSPEFNSYIKLAFMTDTVR